MTGSSSAERAHRGRAARGSGPVGFMGTREIRARGGPSRAIATADQTGSRSRYSPRAARYRRSRSCRIRDPIGHEEIVEPSLENRGWNSSAIPVVTTHRRGWIGVCALMIQMSRSVRPGTRLAKTMCWPSGTSPLRRPQVVEPLGMAPGCGGLPLAAACTALGSAWS